ncbi:MAG: ABC transporter ATP-binding protein [Chitinophagales bacterium]
MKKYLKNILEKYFSSFLFFYRVIGYRIFITVTLSILVGLLDGFGLTMFLPLLQMIGGADNVDSASLGNMSFITDGFEKIGMPLNLNSVLLFMCGFFILKGFAKFISSSYDVKVRQYFIKKVRLSLLNAINNISFKFFVQSDSGRIQNTMTGETDRVMRANAYFIQALQQLVMVGIYMLMAFFVDARFALLVSIGGVLSNFVFNYFYKLTKSISNQLTQNMHGFQGLLIQHISNYKYLKSTGLLKVFGARLQKSILDVEENNKKIGIYNAVLGSLREPLLIIVVSLVIFFQANVLHADLGLILLSLLFFYRGLTSLMLMQTSWNSFVALSGSVINVVSFQKELIYDKQDKGELNFNKFISKLQLQEVVFSYGEKQILKKINLEILKNETIAFVGESGSGKTTLISLIAGLLPPDSGEYLIDTIDVKKINIESFQNRIGYITQEPVIFDDTIYNNITLWAPITKENIKRFWIVAEQANIYSFVADQKDAELSRLGNNGINISGGQKQRISIARELYKDIDFLFMDEATSALDSETENLIQENIEKLRGKCTIIIIAHRLSTIRNADRVVVMKSGEIEHIGSYKDLIQESTSFKRMVDLQNL